MKQYLKVTIFVLVCVGAGALMTCAGDTEFEERLPWVFAVAAAWLLAGLLYSFYRQMPDTKPAVPAPTPTPRRHPRIDIFNEEE